MHETSYLLTRGRRTDTGHEQFPATSFGEKCKSGFEASAPPRQHNDRICFIARVDNPSV